MEPILYHDDLLTPINTCVNQCPASTVDRHSDTQRRMWLMGAGSVFLDTGAEHEIQQKKEDSLGVNYTQELDLEVQCGFCSAIPAGKSMGS